MAWEYIKKQKSGTDPHRAQRRPGPKNFFFEQVKFSENKKKGLGPPLVFSSGPLPKYHEPLEPIIRLTQEPMTQVNLLKKKKNTQLSVVRSPTPNRESKKARKKKKKERKLRVRGETEDRKAKQRVRETHSPTPMPPPPTPTRHVAVSP